MRTILLLFLRQLRKIYLFVNNHFGRYGKQWNIKTQLEKLSELTFQESQITPPFPCSIKCMQISFPKGLHWYICTFISLDACLESNLLLDKDVLMNTCCVTWIDTDMEACLIWKSALSQQPSSGLHSSVLEKEEGFFSSDYYPSCNRRIQHQSGSRLYGCLSNPLSCLHQWPKV